MEAGYSDTPIATKLGFKAGHRFWCEGPGDHPAAERLTQGLADEVRPGDPFDVAVVFLEWQSELEEAWPRLLPLLDQRGGLWIAWPKRASKRPTDLSDSVVRESGLATGLVDNKVCAIDETWSALRFVVRKANRT